VLAEGLLFGLIPLAADPDAVSAPFTHDRAIMGLSMIAGVIGAYAALEAAGEAIVHRGAARLMWLLISGAVMGAGVWDTHWIGLLAFSNPLLHGFDPTLTLYSLAAAAGGSALAFSTSWDGAPWRIALAGVLGGLCAIWMHYLGMHGLVIEAELTYRPLWALLSGAAAVIAITIGYWLAHNLATSWLRAAVALPIGAVATGIHYFDVGATVITPAPQFTAAPEPPAVFMAALAALGGLILLVGLTLAGVAWSRRRAATAAADPTRDDYVVVIPTPGAGRRIRDR